MTSSRPDPGEFLSDRVGGLRSGPIEPLNLVRPCPELIDVVIPARFSASQALKGRRRPLMDPSQAA
jgi:hypothetical protein